MLKLVNQMSILVCILTLNLNHAQSLASQRSDFFLKNPFLYIILKWCLNMFSSIGLFSTLAGNPAFMNMNKILRASSQSQVHNYNHPFV